MRLTRTEFTAEKRYQGLMHFLRRILREKGLTLDEYVTVSREYALRLSPKTGTLLSLREIMLRERQNDDSKEGRRTNADNHPEEKSGRIRPRLNANRQAGAFPRCSDQLLQRSDPEQPGMDIRRRVR